MLSFYVDYEELDGSPLPQDTGLGYIVNIVNGNTLRTEIPDGTMLQCRIAKAEITEQHSAGDFLRNPAKLLKMLELKAQGIKSWPCYYKFYRFTWAPNYLRLIVSNDCDGVQWDLFPDWY